MSSIANHLQDLKARAKGCKVIAVSKTRDIGEIRQALNAGQRSFGENRVQEAANKFPQLRSEYPDLDLHLIGPLQTNKVTAALKLFNVIQTLDRQMLAEKLASASKSVAVMPRLYVEVNIGEEPQKAGLAPSDLDAFVSFCRTACRLQITGLMCIPPRGRDPIPFFKAMHVMKERVGVKNLSMGMSADFEAAIACGATEVRIGTAIFGAH